MILGYNHITYPISGMEIRLNDERSEITLSIFRKLIKSHISDLFNGSELK